MSTMSSSASQGGSDFDLDRLVALCRPCHEETDAPYAKGRLVITPLGAGRFSFEVVREAGTWSGDRRVGASDRSASPQ